MGVLRQADPRCGLADEMVEGAIPKPSVPALPLPPQPAVLTMASSLGIRHLEPAIRCAWVVPLSRCVVPRAPRLVSLCRSVNGPWPRPPSDNHVKCDAADRMVDSQRKEQVEILRLQLLRSSRSRRALHTACPLPSFLKYV